MLHRIRRYRHRTTAIVLLGLMAGWLSLFCGACLAAQAGELVQPACEHAMAADADGCCQSGAGCTQAHCVSAKAPTLAVEPLALPAPQFELVALAAVDHVPGLQPDYNPPVAAVAADPPGGHIYLHHCVFLI